MAIAVEYLADHLDAIPVIAERLFAEWGYRSPTGSVEGMAQTLRMRTNRDRLPLALVALSQAGPIGTVSLKIREVDIRPEYEHWLGTLYVSERHRNKGVGSRLVQSAKGVASRLGISELYLYTRNPHTQIIRQTKLPKLPHGFRGPKLGQIVLAEYNFIDGVFGAAPRLIALVTRAAVDWRRWVATHLQTTYFLMKLQLLPLLGIVLLVSCTNAPHQVGVTETSQPDSELGAIVDNQDDALRVEGQWSVVQSPTAYHGDCLSAPFWKNPADGSLDPVHFATATVHPQLPQAGMYEVYVWWCSASIENLSTQQRIWLCASQGYSCVSIYSNPHDNVGQWHGLGVYYMDIDGDITVRNGKTAWGAPPGWEIIADGAVVIDAFRFVYRGPRPMILTPLPFQPPEPSPTPGA